MMQLLLLMMMVLLRFSRGIFALKFFVEIGGSIFLVLVLVADALVAILELRLSERRKKEKLQIDLNPI